MRRSRSTVPIAIEAMLSIAATAVQSYLGAQAAAQK